MAAEPTIFSTLLEALVLAGAYETTSISENSQFAYRWGYDRRDDAPLTHRERLTVNTDTPQTSITGTKSRWVTYVVLALFSIGGIFACSWWSLETRDSPKKVAEKAPTFTLQNQASQPIKLANANTNGAVMLVFYRGHW